MTQDSARFRRRLLVPGVVWLILLMLLAATAILGYRELILRSKQYARILREPGNGPAGVQVRCSRILSSLGVEHNWCRLEIECTSPTSLKECVITLNGTYRASLADIALEQPGAFHSAGAWTRKGNNTLEPGETIALSWSLDGGSYGFRDPQGQDTVGFHKLGISTMTLDCDQGSSTWRFRFPD